MRKHLRPLKRITMDFSMLSIYFLLSFSPTAGLNVNMGSPCCSSTVFHCVLYRVVNMSSMLGRISRIMPGRQKAILDPNLTIEKLTSLMDEFVK